MELSVPLMLYWDLPDDVPEDVVASVCDDILSLGILKVDLGARGRQAGVVGAIASRLTQGTTAVYVTAPAGEAATFSGANSPPGLRGCFSHIEDLTEMGMVPANAAGVSLPVTRTNFRDLPSVAARCAATGIGKLVLSMERLQRGDETFCLSGCERAELADLLTDSPLPESLRVTAHDPFLWSILFPNLPHPENGCQAANTMLYVGADLDVWPCPSFPLPLGNLRRTSLAAVIESGRRSDLRKQISEPPTECRSCADVAACRGGCRGRSFARFGTLAAADPGCGRPI